MVDKVLALCGGVGGAKLALGLNHCLSPDQLTILVNTADDFEHLGLHISPDIDTVMYTLAGINNGALGWGIEGETWHCLAALEVFGGETWFRLGDRDLATHLFRTSQLKQGASLTDITGLLCQGLGVETQILPMSDDCVRTMVATPTGEIAFQHYFVKAQCQPTVCDFHFVGIETARPNPLALALLNDPQLTGIIICPSNPYVSIDPILALDGFSDALKQAKAPVVAVSPIVGGAAIKGPTAKMMRELSIPTTPTAIVEHYQGLIDGFIFDNADHQYKVPLSDMHVALNMTNTVMKTLEDKILLAETALTFMNEISGQKSIDHKNM